MFRRARLLRENWSRWEVSRSSSGEKLLKPFILTKSISSSHVALSARLENSTTENSQKLRKTVLKSVFGSQKDFSGEFWFVWTKLISDIFLTHKVHVAINRQRARLTILRTTSNSQRVCFWNVQHILVCGYICVISLVEYGQRESYFPKEIKEMIYYNITTVPFGQLNWLQNIVISREKRENAIDVLATVCNTVFRQFFLHSSVCTHTHSATLTHTRAHTRTRTAKAETRKTCAHHRIARVWMTSRMSF